TVDLRSERYTGTFERKLWNQHRMPQFDMTIDEVYEVPNGRLVVCGKATAGEIHVGDQLFVHSGNSVIPVRVKFLEAFHNVGPQIGYAGDNVVAGIEGIQKSDISRGSRL